MLSDRHWRSRLAIGLLVVSTAIYLTRYLIFGQGDELLRYLLDDIAFLLVQALIVTLFLDRLLAEREREAMLHKLNMVIGAFFSEMGTRLMGDIASFDEEFDPSARRHS